MSPIIFGILLLVGITVVVYFMGEPENMQEKRTYMFETEEGERYNPFSDMSEGSEDVEEREWKYDINDF